MLTVSGGKSCTKGFSDYAIGGDLIITSSWAYNKIYNSTITHTGFVPDIDRKLQSLHSYRRSFSSHCLHLS